MWLRGQGKLAIFLPDEFGNGEPAITPTILWAEPSEPDKETGDLKHLGQDRLGDDGVQNVDRERRLPIADNRVAAGHPLAGATLAIGVNRERDALDIVGMYIEWRIFQQHDAGLEFCRPSLLAGALDFAATVFGRGDEAVVQRKRRDHHQPIATEIEMLFPGPDVLILRALTFQFGGVVLAALAVGRHPFQRDFGADAGLKWHTVTHEIS